MNIPKSVIPYQVKSLALLVGVLSTSPLALAQREWRTEEIETVGMKFSINRRLERLPMRLDSSNPYLRARMQPQERGDYINNRFAWNCYVLEFVKEPKKDLSDEDLADMSPEQRKIMEKIREMMGSQTVHTSFESYLGEIDNIEILRDGKKRSGSRKNPEYREYTWLRRGHIDPAGVGYNSASVYEFQDREVAIMVSMPLLKGKAKKPKSKWASIIKRILRSGQILADEEAEEDVTRDKFADTEEKKSALAKAKENIGSLKGWDYYTTPNYIVVYSWDYKDPSTRARAKKQSKFYSSRLERMRDFFIRHYPLGPAGLRGIAPDPSTIPSPDGPTTGAKKDEKDDKDEKEDGEEEETVEIDLTPTKGKDVPTYSIFRLCATYEQFLKYGSSSRGVVGWFSPVSKELVVFLGGDEMMGDGATETVTYHEGWHQFADLYFSNPKGRNGNLHRWFDEGHGDFFGAFRPKGSSSFSYKGSAMRYDSVKNMVEKGDYVPFKEIVTWNRRKFYGRRAAYYYAQAFSMIDYLRRGEKLKKHWKPHYAGVLDMYRKVMLVYYDSDRAVRTAFREFRDEDWLELEEAWKAWVGSSHFKDG